MAINIENISVFRPDETGIFNGISGSSASNILFNLQKSSINTIESVCFSPFGQVSNINCPDWDPACNCFINQYKPKELPKTDSELIELKKKTSECELIYKEIVKKFDQPYWFGVDFSNHKCPYNCLSEEFTLNSNGYDAKYFKDVKINYFGITGTISKDTFYPYNIGYYGNSGPVLNLDPSDGIQPSNDIFIWDKEKIKPLDYKLTTGENENNISINKPLFKSYLEYSKTNATFWNTPAKTPLLRNAFMGLYGFQKIKIAVNGSYLIKIGSLINITMPIKDEISESGTGLNDKRFAGTWMVYRIERTIIGGKHTMNLFLMRDGYNNNKYNKPVLNTYGRRIIKQNNGNNTP